MRLIERAAIWWTAGAAAAAAVAVVVLATATAQGPSTARIAMQSTLLFWGFDDLFMREPRNGKVDLERVNLGGRVKNLIAVSASGQMVALLGAEPKTGEFAIFTLELPGGQVQLRMSRHAQRIALAPGGRRIAYTCYASARQTGEDDVGDAYDIGIYDLTAKEDSLLLRRKASRSTILSWHADGQQLAFDSDRGRIESVNIGDGKVTTMFSGRAPAWSPDGAALAYVSGKGIFVYDARRGAAKRLYKRRFWQTDITMPLHWSPDSQLLAFNVYAGPEGKEYSCELLGVASGKLTTLPKGFHWCGPFITGRSGK